jgi:hypothetical protein
LSVAGLQFTVSDVSDAPETDVTPANVGGCVSGGVAWVRACAFSSTLPKASRTRTTQVYDDAGERPVTVAPVAPGGVWGIDGTKVLVQAVGEAAQQTRYTSASGGVVSSVALPQATASVVSFTAETLLTPPKTRGVVSAGVEAALVTVLVSTFPAASRARTASVYVVAGASEERTTEVAPGAVVNTGLP